MKLKTPTFPRKGHHDSVVNAPAFPAPVAPSAPAAPQQHVAPVAPVATTAAAAPAMKAATPATATALKKVAGGLEVPARQRNAAAMIAGLVFIIIAGAIGASVAASFDVLVASSSIAEGQPITEEDFRVVQIAAGAGDIQAVSPDSIDSLIGRVAAGPIGEGSMIHPDQFALPYSDQQIIVGAALVPDQYPAGGLKIGDQVRLIALAGRSGGDDDDAFVAGEEVSIGQITDFVNLGNEVHFSIRVPESSVNAIAQLVALNRISLALLDESIDTDQVSPLDPAEVNEPLTLEPTE